MSSQREYIYISLALIFCIKNEMPYLALILSMSKMYLYIAVARILNITAIMAIP